MLKSFEHETRFGVASSTASNRLLFAVRISCRPVDLPDGSREGILSVAILRRRLHHRRPREIARWPKRAEATANDSDLIAASTVQSIVRHVTEALPQGPRSFSKGHGADRSGGSSLVPEPASEDEESSKEIEGRREGKRQGERREDQAGIAGKRLHHRRRFRPASQPELAVLTGWYD